MNMIMSVVGLASFLVCSDEDKHAFEAWQAHDDVEDNFCELDGELRNFEVQTNNNEFELVQSCTIVSILS